MWKFALPAGQEHDEAAARTASGTISRGPSRRARRPRGSWRSTGASSPTPATRPARIIEEARQSADEVEADEIQAQAETDADEFAPGPRRTSGSPPSGRWLELRGRVAELSIELAEKIVERNLDRDTQLALVESYIDQVGNGNGSR